MIKETIMRTGDIWIPYEGQNEDGIIRYGNLCTLCAYADMEDRIAERIQKMRQQTPVPLIEVFIFDFERKFDAHLNALQHLAVERACTNRLSILTGGPGTGKTTTVRCIAYCLARIGETVTFTAPTGKAALRLSEQVGAQARTLHSALGIGYDVRKARPYVSDALIIDEASQADLELADALFRVTDENKRLVFVGDPDQLPSVGPGAVFRDMINSGIVPVTSLELVYRQGDDTLATNIRKVKEGITDLSTSDCFQIHMCGNDPMEIDRLICGLYEKEAAAYGRENVSILIPYKRAGYGSDRINRLIKDSSPSLKTAFGRFSLHDPVMQLRNRPECVNGEVGEVTRIGTDRITVTYAGCEVEYTEKTAVELDLAYAISVTKSQGSEYQSVILCMLGSHINALNRNNLYTGISRAKKKITLITQEGVIGKCMSDSGSDRTTLLAEKLRALA